MRSAFVLALRLLVPALVVAFAQVMIAAPPGAWHRAVTPGAAAAAMARRPHATPATPRFAALLAHRTEYHHHHPRPFGGWCRINGWHTHYYVPQESAYWILARAEHTPWTPRAT